jgi:hypothetical protein
LKEGVVNKVVDILDKMRDHVLRMEYCVKKNELTSGDFDDARDLLREHQDLVSDLGSELASAEDCWRREN